MEISLKEKQKWTLNQKIDHSFGVIEQFYNAVDGKVYISFSGGKDSTVLLHLVRTMYPNVPAIFLDTGLEFPEIRDFVKTFENVEWLKPRKHFKKIIEENGIPYPSKEIAQGIRNIKYGTEKLRNIRLYGDEKGTYGKISDKWHYLKDAPFEISDECCNYLKKYPVGIYERKNKKRPFIGTMASESRLRESEYKKNGCNNLNSKKPTSKPLSIWTEKDIWQYLRLFDLSYSNIYDMGYERTGCMFCLFGIQHEKSNLFEKNRIQRLRETHPKQYDYMLKKLNFEPLLKHERINYL